MYCIVRIISTYTLVIEMVYLSRILIITGIMGCCLATRYFYLYGHLYLMGTYNPDYMVKYMQEKN